MTLICVFMCVIKQGLYDVPCTQFMRAVDNVIMSSCVTPPCVALSRLSRHVNDVIYICLLFASPSLRYHRVVQCFSNNSRADWLPADWLSARWSSRERRVCTSRWLTESWVSSYVCTCTVRNITNNCHSRSFVTASRKIVRCSIRICDVEFMWASGEGSGSFKQNKILQVHKLVHNNYAWYRITNHIETLMHSAIRNCMSYIYCIGGGKDINFIFVLCDLSHPRAPPSNEQLFLSVLVQVSYVS